MRKRGILAAGTAVVLTVLPASPAPGARPARPALEVPPPDPGYLMVERSGVVHAFGGADWYGNAPTTEAVDIATTPSFANGYWVVDRGGHVYAFGNAKWYGDATGLQLFESVVAIAAIPPPRAGGYRLFTSRGRVLQFDSGLLLPPSIPGDLTGVRLNAPIIDAVSTPYGNGYYMVAEDGGVFTFGNAAFYGSMGATRLNAPVLSLVPDGDGVGYWLVASDGGIFAFDAPFRGSMGATPLNRPVRGMVRYGAGYLMVGEDGGIFSFSDLPFLGSLGANPPPTPVVSVASKDR